MKSPVSRLGHCVPGAEFASAQLLSPMFCWSKRVCLLVAMLALFLAALRSAAAETQSHPNIDHLIRQGRENLKRMAEAPVSWRMVYKLPNRVNMEARMFRDRQRRSWVFSADEGGRTQTIAKIVEADGIWHVSEGDHHYKCLPYGAELRSLGGYFLFSLADPRTQTEDPNTSKSTFARQTETTVTYRVPLSQEQHQMIKKSLEALDQLGKSDPSRREDPDVEEKMTAMSDLLANGSEVTLGTTTGLLSLYEANGMTVSLEDFRWLSSVPAKSFQLPETAPSHDGTRRWSENELGKCILVARDPLFEGGSGKPNLDGYLFNLESGEFRRLPFKGIGSMAGCFESKRQQVIVSGYGADGSTKLVRLYLSTGENSFIEQGTVPGGIPLGAELSPDGQSVATIQMGTNGSVLDFQVRIVNLRTGASRVLGKPDRIGGPFSWLPDGSGLVLKRFKSVPDPTAIEPRILCRMDLEGNLTDLRPGDSPLVLRKSRRILYEADKSRLWHTCELDGSEPKLFADGLPSHGTPAVSPDETKIIFARYEKGKLPELLLFDLGSARGRSVAKDRGFTGMPIWR